MSSGVTVIVPTYNRADYIGMSLDSLLNQSRTPDKVIVVDDGSTDDTESRLAPYRNRIQYLKKPNGGKSSALNLALPQVESEYVWVFDDDDIANPDALQLHLEVLESDPGIGFTYSSYQKASIAPDGSIELGFLQEVGSFRHREFFIRLMEECLLTQPAIVVRSQCYRELGAFNESLVRSQDYEMLLRLSRRYRAGRVAKPTYLYRVHEGTRGSANASFNASHAQDKWVEYDRVILRDLRQDLALWEYLPEIESARELSPEESRRALIQRFCIMMHKSLWDQALQDLSQILQATAAAGPLTETEKKILCRVFANRASFLLRCGYNPQDFSRCFSQGARSLSLALRVELSRSLYYSFRRDLAQNNHRDAWFLLRHLVRLLGFSGIAGALQLRSGTTG